MRTFATLSILLLFSAGLTRAFLDSPSEWDQMLARQKAEIIYRNAIVQPLTEETIDKTKTAIEDLMNRHPFLSKTDRQWITEKLKELEVEKKKSVKLSKR